MKEVIQWHYQITSGASCGVTVMAYRDSDLEKLKPVLDKARAIWLQTWHEQGAIDEGSCCGGKGIQVVYLGKRKRNWEYLTVIPSPPVQGNISAQRSVQPALDYLKSEGIDATYYDGWMN